MPALPRIVRLVALACAALAPADAPADIVAEGHEQPPHPADPGERSPAVPDVPRDSSSRPVPTDSDAALPSDVRPDPSPGVPAWAWPVLAGALVIAGLAALRLNRRPEPRPRRLKS